MTLRSHSDCAVAIVTGGALPDGRYVACGLARGAWPVVIIYLDHQLLAESTAAEIIVAGGTTIAVRADLGRRSRRPAAVHRVDSGIRRRRRHRPHDVEQFRAALPACGVACPSARHSTVLVIRGRRVSE